jgi:hypothetical protein
MEQDKLMSYPRKWFVLHHKNLFNENQHIIGFRDIDEWERINKGDLVVYYQARASKLKGIYEVINTQIDIDPTFGKPPEFHPGELKHQHELKLLHKLSASFHQDRAEFLSFHRNLKNPNRWDGKRVHSINNDDLKYILSL